MTIKLLLSAIIALSLFLSCNKTQELESSLSQGQILAVMPSETKIGYGTPVDGVYPVVWTSGDKIKLYSESVTSGEDYAFTRSEGTGVAVFTGTPVSGNSRYAIYPSSRAVGMEDGVLKVSFGSLRKQKFSASLEDNSINLGYLPMWAKEGNGSGKGRFSFQNTCGALMFRLNNPPADLKSVSITSGTRYISGMGLLDASTGEMELVNENAGKKTFEKGVSISLEGMDVADSDGIVVSLPAGTYEPDELTVTLTYGDKTYEKPIKSKLTVIPGVVRPLPVISFSDDLSIEWETPKPARTANKPELSGGYPRIHRLNDGRLMLSYSLSGNGCARFSSDEGKTWGAQTEVMSYFDKTSNGVSARMTASVPDFAQLSAGNPYHPGRIIYASNYRPRELVNGKTTDNTGWTTVHPYTISISVSDDAGKTWSARKHLYKSGIWDKNVTVGCWEPFVLELPDGTVQIYFADETPYYPATSWHNISVIESKDGGNTWGEVRVVAQNSANRDGMPVATLLGDKILLAVESTDGVHKRLHPIVICNPIQGCWSTTVGKGDSHRFHPFTTSLKSDLVYSGAPYIITTDNYIVYSYQISDWWKPTEELSKEELVSLAKQKNIEAHSELEVQVCLKSEVTDGFFYTMRSPSRPFKLDQQSEKAVWNSLCDLGNDEILAVSQKGNLIYTVRGKIVAK